MPSSLELLKQRTTELEAENSGLRIKLSVSDAEIAELKRSNIEFLRANEEYNERRDAEITKLRAENVEFRDRLTKVEQKQTLQSALTANDNSSNISSSNFNLVADQISMVTHHEKPLVLPEDKETDAFLDEEYKKKVSNEIRQRNREKKLCFNTSGQTQESLPTHPKEKISQDLNSVTQPCNSTSSEEKICSELDSKCKKGKGVDKLKQELFAPELPSQVPIEQNHVTKIS